MAGRISRGDATLDYLRSRSDEACREANIATKNVHDMLLETIRLRVELQTVVEERTNLASSLKQAWAEAEKWKEQCEKLECELDKRK